MATFRVYSSSGFSSARLISTWVGNVRPRRQFEIRTSSGAVIVPALRPGNVPFVATMLSRSSLSASLTTGIPIAATLAADGPTLTAGLTTAIRLSATLTAVAAASGELDTSVPGTARPRRRFEIRSSSGAAWTQEPRAAFTAARIICNPETAYYGALAYWQADPGFNALWYGTKPGVPATLQAQGIGATLEAAIAGEALVGGQLTTAIRMVAALAAQPPVVAASLTTAISAAAALRSTFSITGDIQTAIPLAADLTGSASVFASLDTEEAGSMSAALICEAMLDADLTTSIYLEAVLTARASVAATLTGGAPFPEGEVMSVPMDDDDMEVPMDDDVMDVPEDFDEMVVV